jgi:hypothetical protein
VATFDDTPGNDLLLELFRQGEKIEMAELHHNWYHPVLYNFFYPVKSLQMRRAFCCATR